MSINVVKAESTSSTQSTSAGVKTREITTERQEFTKYKEMFKTEGADVQAILQEKY